MCRMSHGGEGCFRLNVGMRNRFWSLGLATISSFGLGYAVSEWPHDGSLDVPRHWWSLIPALALATVGLPALAYLVEKD